MGSLGERLADRIRAFARPWELASFVLVPAIVLGFSFLYEFRAKAPLQDYSIFRGAASAVLHGHSPFVAPTVHALAGFDKFVYPPVTALLFSPLNLLPLEAARVFMLVSCVICVIVALRILDVSDWRCYGVAAMSAPVVNSLALGALTPLLLVGVAVTWRYRDRPAVAGPTGAITAALKLFLWPLGVWLLVTRRLRATVMFAIVAVALLGVGWAAIGFAGLTSYPRLLHVLTNLEAHTSYSLVALLRLSGAATAVLSAALVAAGVLAVVLAAHGDDGERRSFAVAIAAAMAVTPVLWLHYLVLLFVPIALYRPRLSALWFAPLLLWLTPTTHSHGSLWRIAFALVVSVGVVAVALTGLGAWWSAVRRSRTRPLLVRDASGVAGIE